MADTRTKLLSKHFDEIHGHIDKVKSLVASYHDRKLEDIALSLEFDTYKHLRRLRTTLDVPYYLDNEEEMYGVQLAG